MMNVYSPIYKVILVGDSGVGKTCLLSMYVKGIIESTIPTIAVEFCTKEIELYDGTKIKVQLWDTAGQERFKSLALTYYRKAYGILLLFDVTKKSSFISCKNYLEEVRMNSEKKCIVYLVGNKIDLVNERQISKEEAQRFSSDHIFNYFIETSAKTGFNAQSVFIRAAKELYITHLDYKDRASRVGSITPATDSFQQDINMNNNFMLDDEEEKPRKKKGCC